MMLRRLLRFLMIVLFASVSSACNLLYRMDIEQGNEITQEMMSKLKPGMTRSQVRFVLGTALIEDPFRPNRWDYYYSLRHGVTGKAQQRHLVIYFDGDTLARIEGDVVPPQLKAEGELLELAPKTLMPTPFNSEAAPNANPAKPGVPSPPATGAPLRFL